MHSMYLAVLTATLQRLNIPYTVSGDMITIEPLTSAQMEIIPGEWTDKEGKAVLLLDIKEFDLIGWTTWLVNNLEEKI